MGCPVRRELMLSLRFIVVSRWQFLYCHVLLILHFSLSYCILERLFNYCLLLLYCNECTCHYIDSMVVPRQGIVRNAQNWHVATRYCAWQQQHLAPISQNSSARCRSREISAKRDSVRNCCSALWNGETASLTLQTGRQTSGFRCHD